MSTAVQERVIELLGAGIQPVQVAAACGVTESWVSQIQSDEGNAARIAELRSIRASQYVEHDTKIDDLEKRALKKIGELLPMIMKPMEAVKVFQTLNAAKRKTDAASQQHTQTATIVNLEIPANAMVGFKMTVDKQVIEVEGRSMLPLSAQEVAKKLKDKQTKELLEHSLTLPNQKLEVPALIDQI